MKKRTISFMMAILFASASLLFAADQSRDRKHDRKRDGSCRTELITNTGDHLLAADQTRDREHDRKQDGSCQS